MSFSDTSAETFAAFFADRLLQPYLKLLFEKLSEGSICMQIPEVSLAYALNKQFVGNEHSEDKPLIYSNGRLYLQRYFKYETQLVTKINELIHTKSAKTNDRLNFLISNKQLIKKLFKDDDTDTNWQLISAILAFINNFTIITGGPGTGKTTTVAKILALILRENPQAKIALAAPTGKAAARMAESIKNSAELFDENTKAILQDLVPTTIHRLLGYKKGSIYFKHNDNNFLTADIVIIDESSMLDIALFAKLVSAIGHETRIIFLGDKNQLSSVEAGSIFGDMCSSLPVPNLFNKKFAEQFEQITRLKPENISDQNNNGLLQNHIIELQKSHRFSADSGIGTLAKGVLENDTNIVYPFINNEHADDIKFDTVYSDSFFEGFICGYEEYILEKNIFKAFEKLNKLRVLCAVKNGNYGLYQTNKAIEKYLHQRGLISFSNIFYENRPIILTKNYPNFGVFNGEVGIVRKDENEKQYAWFVTSEGELRKILPGYLQEAETAFAMTIHKSQGSEFENILIRLPEATESKILSMELVYTAITRAKKKLFIQSTEEAFLAALGKKVERASGLAQRLKGQ